MKLRWRRWLFLGLGALLLLVLLAPRLANSGWVRRQVEARLGEAAGVEIRIDRISAGWWSALEIGGVEATVREGEFAGSRLASLTHARLATGILGLLSGPDSLDLEVHGLVVTIEERAGSRTNLDPLLAELMPAATKAPAVTPRETPKEREPGPALRVRITGSRIELRRLRFQPPGRRINPFREDPPIRSIQDGLDIYAIDAALLELGHTGTETQLRADVAILHGQDRATLKADLRVEGERVGGEVTIKGFDLDLLDPLLPSRLDGRVSLHAAGEYRPGRSHARIDLDVADLATDEIEEKWVKGRIELEESADAVRVGSVELSSASGRFATSGALTLPKEEPTRPSGTLKGTFPLAPIFRMIAHKQPLPGAQIRFDLSTNLSPTGGRLDALVHLDHFTEPLLPKEVTLRFALQGERATRRLTIDSFALRSEYARADFKGTIVRPPKFAAELSGEASGDLERLLFVASHFESSLGRIEAGGHGRLVLRSLRTGPDGALELAAHARVERLRMPQGTEFIDVQADFDGTFFDNFDRLELRTARFRDLRLEGTFSGLRAADALPACDARLRGSLPVTTRLARMLSLPVEELEAGSSVDVTLRSDGTRLRTEGTLDARDVVCRIRDIPCREEKIEANWQLEYDGESVRGKAAASGLKFLAHATSIRYGVAKQKWDVAGEFRFESVEMLAELLLDERTVWRGRHGGEFVLERSPGHFAVSGRVSSGDLTLLHDGHGIDGRRTIVDARASYDNEQWSLTGTRLEVPALELTAEAKVLDFGGEARIHAQTRFEHWQRYLPDSTGPLDLTASRSVDGKFAVEARSGNFSLAGKSYGELRLTASGIEAGPTLRLPSVRVESGSGVDLLAHGELADEFRFHLSSKGEDFGKVAAWIPEVSGSGAYRIELDVVVPLRRTSSRFELTGSGAAAHVEGEGQVIEGLAFTLDADFLRRPGALEDLRLEGSIRAQRAKTPAAILTGLEFRNEGRGTLRLDGGGAGHRFRKLSVKADRVQIQERAMERIRIDGRGVLHRPQLGDPGAIEVYGKISFEKIQAAVLDWLNGTARLSYDKQVVILDELSASANGGRVSGHARADLSRANVPWSVKLVLEDAKLTTGFTDPLSYVLPILRLSGHKQGAKGFVSAVAELSADGSTWERIRKSLRGKGNLRLRDSEISGSLLMPLLSLRVGRLLLNKPYRIPDSTMNWKVQNGLVTTDPLKLGGKPFSISMGGTAHLNGELNYIIHPGILLVPLRVGGTWDKISVRPAPAEALPKWPWNK